MLNNMKKEKIYMIKVYEIMCVSEDFGTMKNEKTGKFENWKGKRLVCMEYDKDDKSGGVIVQGMTKVFKASRDLPETVPTGVMCDLLYDANGRVKKVEVLKK